jgi:hypothetical protein
MQARARGSARPAIPARIHRERQSRKSTRTDFWMLVSAKIAGA